MLTPSASFILTVCTGGGSIIDAAKVIILAMANPSVSKEAGLDSIHNIETDSSLKVHWEINPARVPLICVPTTLSAGEYSGFAAATDPRDHIKKLFSHPSSITPTVVILDAALARFSPADIWLSTGVRAMDHCVETLCRITKPDKDADEAAKKGLQLLIRGLLDLKVNPDDNNARLKTLLGACYSMDGSLSSLVCL